MRSNTLAIWITTAAAIFGTAACTLASPTYISSTEAPLDADGGASSSPASPKGAGTATGGAAPSCAKDDYTKPDLSTLTACGDGKGHCFARDKADMAQLLVACPDASQVCVPDNVLAGSGGPTKACASIAGAGGCVTATLYPDIMKQGGSALSKDVCDEGQLCVPCVNPIDQQKSGFCEPLGVHANACATGAAPTTTDGGAAPSLPGCCTKNGKSNGVCIAENTKTEDAPRDSCAAGNKCVPAAVALGNPVVCRAGAILGTGVCIDTCFNDYLDSVGSIVLDQDKCGSTELCVPCSALQGQGIAACP
ncbi:MAG: Tryptophan synthase alpha chain [Labilithrix sp.]|nr:Tryptophan synthase alpha chain [Labilithrix sp.]